MFAACQCSRCILSEVIQQANDCNMILVHDDDLERIDGIGDGTVSGDSIDNHIIPMLAVTRIPPTRNMEVQCRDT